MGVKFLIAMITIFTFFLVICFLVYVYKEALATQRALEYKPAEEDLDTMDMLMDYTE